MTSGMDNLKEAVTTILPSLSPETLEALIVKMIELGVEVIEDLHLLTEDDMTPLLKPIQARKLVSA